MKMGENIKGFSKFILCGIIFAFLLNTSIVFAQSINISQLVDVPIWLRKGMSLANIQQEYSKSGITLLQTEVDYRRYYYSERNNSWSLLIPPDEGLQWYSLVPTNSTLNLEQARSYLIGKYGSPTTISGGIYSWEKVELPNGQVDISLGLEYNLVRIYYTFK